ncbi:MAG: molybdopterin-dependent oxidoreductase [Syntrophales bacterium]
MSQAEGYKTDMITLTIDGKRITTSPGKTILEAAREGGVDIPTLCYHESLLPIGSCRLCIVEVEGYSEPMTACTTPAADGIVVTTRSEKLFAMRREIIKLILVAHPLDCPQCDKGGECRLQDLVYEHGIEKAEYQTFREDHRETYATPLIRYWELRCVLCGRCYRACREISGRVAIDLAGKGFAARIAPSDSNDCISCGECLSLCPVGALTENLSPVKSRPWQTERIDTACPHCGFGCRLMLDVYEGRIVTKVLTKGDLAPNHASLCVRGRFGYDIIDPPFRVTKPLIVADGGTKTLEWEEAVKTAADNLQQLSSEGKGIGFIISPRVTNEELFLLSRIAGLCGKVTVASSAFYHTGKVAAAFRKRGMRFASGYDSLAACDLIIVAGADLLINNHLLANKVRETVKATGARVIVVDPLPAALARIADAHVQVRPGEDAHLFNAFSRRLIQDGAQAKEAEGLEGFAAFKNALLADQSLSPAVPAGAEEAVVGKAYGLIRDAGTIGVIFGSGISDREESLDALLNFCLLAGLPERGAIIPTALQANARGTSAILDSLASPEDVLLSGDISGIVLYEEDPFHYLNAEVARGALAKKEFVAVCDLLPTEATALAGLVIPAASFAEKEGTIVSGDGTPRAVRRAIAGAPGGPEFLQQLLRRLGGKEYGSSDELIGDLIKRLLEKEGGGKGVPEPAARGRFLLPPATAAAPDGTARPYRLILRDLFVNHHLAGRESCGSGISRVQKDALYISPGDAAALALKDGDKLILESASGSVSRPVTVKAGIGPGVLECFLVRERSGMLALSPRLAKVTAVSIRKA